MPEVPLLTTSDILVGGLQRRPTKWSLQHWLYGDFLGAQWVLWLPLKGTRRAYWQQRLRGNGRWEGCGAPWSRY